VWKSELGGFYWFAFEIGTNHNLGHEPRTAFVRVVKNIRGEWQQTKHADRRYYKVGGSSTTTDGIVEQTGKRGKSVSVERCGEWETYVFSLEEALTT
jgi:hypothetical protein